MVAGEADGKMVVSSKVTFFPYVSSFDRLLHDNQSCTMSDAAVKRAQS